MITLEGPGLIFLENVPKSLTSLDFCRVFIRFSEYAKIFQSQKNKINSDPTCQNVILFISKSDLENTRGLEVLTKFPQKVFL